MGNKIIFTHFIYKFMIILLLTVTSNGSQYVYNKWVEKDYKFNRPQLHNLKGKNTESYRFFISKYPSTTVIKITKDNGKYILSGIKTNGSDENSKAIRMEAVISEKEWSTLLKYIENISYDSILYDWYDYHTYSVSSIILEYRKNDTYKMKLYSSEDMKGGNDFKNFLQASKVAKNLFFKILKDEKIEKIVIDLDIEYAQRKKEEELRRKLQEKLEKKAEEKRKKLWEKEYLWKSAETGAVGGIGYFEGMDVNIKNDKGQTPLMIAVKNGYTDVVKAMAEGIVNVWRKDNTGKTAFDYIKVSSTREEKMYRKRMYGVLRVVEVTQIVKEKAKIIQYGYQNDIDMLEITIKGAKCDDFTFPKNTQCLATKPRSNHDIFKAIKAKNNTLFDQLITTVDDLSIKNKSNYSLLWASIHYHNLYALDRLLGLGVNMYELDQNGLKTPVFWVTMINDAKLLKVLLDHGADVNSKDLFGSTALSTAMYKCNNFEAIKILLDNGANPYFKDKRGETVFDKKPRFCKKKENIEKMKQLLNRGDKKDLKHQSIKLNKKAKTKYADEEKRRKNKKFDKYLNTLSDINKVNSQGFTPLHTAVAKKHHYAIQKLLGKGANMHTLDGQFGVWTPFNYTIAMDDSKALKIFLDNGVDINFHHNTGSTVLNDAVRKCEVKMVKLLLDNGANPRIKDGHGDTAMMALKKCNKQTTKEINNLFEGVMLKGKNSTLLKVEKVKFKIEEKRSELARKKTETRAYKKTIKEVENPIFTAIAYKKNNDFDKYLNNIDNIELTDSNRKTLLYVAVEEHNYHAIDKLLQKGADMNAMKEYWTYTPFTYAAARNDLKAVKMFLNKGADANYQYKKSLTILAVAVKQCNIKMIKLLLANEANTKLKDKRGDSAVASLGHCNKKKNKEIASLINNREVK